MADERKFLQYCLCSKLSGGLTSTFRFPTSVQLVLRTVPPDSICVESKKGLNSQQTTLNKPLFFTSTRIQSNLSAPCGRQIVWLFQK